MSESGDSVVKLEQDEEVEEPAVVDQDLPIKEEPGEPQPGPSSLTDPLRPEVSVNQIPETSLPLRSQLNRCQICQHALSTTEVKIGPKGFLTLQRASEARLDNKFPREFPMELVHIHRECRKNYTNERIVAAAARKAFKALNLTPGVEHVAVPELAAAEDEDVLNGSEAAESEISWSNSLVTDPAELELTRKLEICRICECAITSDEAETNQRGLLKLRWASELRADNKFPPGDHATVRVHGACRRQYSNEAAVLRAAGAAPAPAPAAPAPAAPAAPAQRGRDDNYFDYMEQCLFCGSAALAPTLTPASGRARARFSRVSSACTTARLYRTALDYSGPEYEQFRKRIKDKDLVALRARYHSLCFMRFFNPRKYPLGAYKRGRPPSEHIVTQMEHVYEHIENNWGDSQFTVDELVAQLEDTTDRTAIRKISERYNTVRQRNNVIINPHPLKVLEEKWHEQKLDDEKSERLRIVRTAANIILDDIRAILFDNDHYPTLSTFAEDVSSVVPETLKTFMDTVVTKYKKNPEVLDNTVTALSHSVMAAVRPRSFKSPLLLGIGSFIHQNYASKSLIDLLSSLGFCAPYKEVAQLEVSAAFHNKQIPQPELRQFVFDSVEGAKGPTLIGVQCDTPGAEETPIKRLEEAPANFSYGEYKMPLENYVHGTSGLKNITVENHRDDTAILPTRGDALWLFGKTDPAIDVPSWDVFMSKMPKDIHPVSEISPLPIIDAPASYDSIYTALKQAQNNTKGVCVVTLGQPLYQKAQEIVNSDSEMCNVVLRLGGFDVVKAFLGVIGYIMSGSGLRELWCGIYAAEQTEKMMSGHAYTPAVRAHFLTRSALFNIITKDFELTPDERLEIEGILEGDMLQSDNQTRYQDPLMITLELLEKRGPTAQLWVQYFRMTTLVAQFMEAEKSANWSLHLSTIKKMLPYFYAAGYFDYAKSCSLYLQDMQALESKMSAEEYEAFAKKGYFAVKWSEKNWADDWTDQAVDKAMGMMRRPGGLTNGTKVTDSLLAMWLRACPVLSKLSHLVENFCRPSGEVGPGKNKDNLDAVKLKTWFDEHNPFPEAWDLVSLTGALHRDATCHEAEEVGKAMMAESFGQNFQELKYNRDKCVRPLSSHLIKIENSKVPIEADTILKRIPITKKNQEKLKKFFKYELAPYPLSLFDDNGMLETKKSSLFEWFVPVEVGEGNRSHVIDGEFLLHKVSWKDGATVSNIAYAYVEYVKTYFSNAIVIFGRTKGTDASHSKTKSKSPIVEFQKDTIITVGQENFLSNEKNRDRFIQYLIIDFTRSGIKIKLSSNDVHLDIVQTAMVNSFTFDQTCVVSDNVDLLVKMCALSNKENIYFMRPGRGRKAPVYYQVDSFGNNKIKLSILFIHAVSGSDNTSAIFSQGKTRAGLTIANMYSKDVKDLMSVFKDPTSDKHAIAAAGEKFIRHLYGDALNELHVIRYNNFAESVTRSRYDLARLPPSKDAVAQHMFRTYHQVQKWLGNNLPPTEWGWKLDGERLEPIMTLSDVAPKELLDMVSCKCDGLCSGKCVCKRAGLGCCVLCIDCSGKSCHGIEMDSSIEAGSNSLLRCDAYGNPVDTFESNEDDLSDDDDVVVKTEPASPRAKRVKRDTATMLSYNEKVMSREVEEVYVLED